MRMRKSVFPENGVWLKGNPHSHTTVSDGYFEPLELAKLYASQGYDFLSMTDHNIFLPHNELPPEELLLLTGVEHDLEYGSDKCTHIIGLGRAGQAETSYPCRKYTSRELTDQQYLDMMVGDGQFVVLAHPVWSRMEPEEVAALHGFHAIEIYNNGTEHLCHAGHAEIYWDMLLRRGCRVYGIACDDVHVPCDLFGGWLWVKAAERSREAVLDALHSGSFYSSSGPIIYDFGLDGDKVYISCSPCREIHMVSYPPRGNTSFNENQTEAAFVLTGREKYIRLECIDETGHVAWTNPIFFD